MFQPPDGSTDFDADADAAENYTASAESAYAAWTNDQDAFGDEGKDKTELSLQEQELELQMQKLQIQRAELARRRATPQVIDSSGEPVDDTAPPEPAWPHSVIEIQGKQVQVKQPSAAAIRYLGVFGFGEAGVERGDFQDFMHRHISPKSVTDIRTWTYDGAIDENFYNDLIKKLTTMGTNRPTGPSSSSQRRR